MMMNSLLIQHLVIILVNTSMAFFNTQMAMAKEVCPLMDGDANLAISASGE